MRSRAPRASSNHPGGIAPARLQRCRVRARSRSDPFRCRQRRAVATSARLQRRHDVHSALSQRRHIQRVRSPSRQGRRTSPPCCSPRTGSASHRFDTPPQRAPRRRRRTLAQGFEHEMGYQDDRRRDAHRQRHRGCNSSCDDRHADRRRYADASKHRPLHDRPRRAGQRQPRSQLRRRALRVRVLAQPLLVLPANRPEGRQAEWR